MNHPTDYARATHGVALLLTWAAAAALVSVAPTADAQAMPRTRSVHTVSKPTPRLWVTPNPRLRMTPDLRLRA